MVCIFDYTDYRRFLRDYYTERKKRDPSFSHRVFLAKAGFSGPNFLKNVMDGTRNLSPRSVAAFSRGLGLGKREERYFGALVRFNQAKTARERREALEELGSFAHRSKAVTLAKRQFAYLDTWYAVAIREYIHSHPFSGDFAALGASLHPEITASKARKAVKLLEQLGLVEKGGDGRYVVVQPLVTTGPQVRGMAAQAYHEEMTGLARRALEDFPSDQRYFRGMTVSMSQEARDRVAREIESLVERVREIIADDQAEQRVFQINLQLFPLEKKKVQKGGHT